jgi:hypothetical protein
MCHRPVKGAYHIITKALRFVTRKQADADIQAAIPNFEMPR